MGSYPPRAATPSNAASSPIISTASSDPFSPSSRPSSPFLPHAAGHAGNINSNSEYDRAQPGSPALSDHSFSAPIFDQHYDRLGSRSPALDYMINSSNDDDDATLNEGSSAGGSIRAGIGGGSARYGFHRKASQLRLRSTSIGDRSTILDLGRLSPRAAAAASVRGGARYSSHDTALAASKTSNRRILIAVLFALLAVGAIVGIVVELRRSNQQLSSATASSSSSSSPSSPPSISLPLSASITTSARQSAPTPRINESKNLPTGRDGSTVYLDDGTSFVYSNSFGK